MWTLPRSADLAPRRGIHDARIGGGRDESGAAAVEFALVVPLLLFILLGIVNLGVLYSDRTSMNAATRDAARMGIVKGVTGNPLTCAEIAEHALDNANVFSSATIRAEVANSPGGASVCAVTSGTDGSRVSEGSATAFPCVSPAAQLSVRVSADMAQFVPFSFNNLIFPDLNKHASSSTFRCEYSSVSP